MPIDYDSHPAELVTPGRVSPKIRIQELRSAIPTYCFESFYRKSLRYLFQDITLAVLSMIIAHRYIPQIENSLLRYSAWGFYGWFDGLVLGHESGHGAFLPSKLANDIVGFVLHTALMTPYFSWQSTHRRHHIYANNMKLDHNFVPPKRSEYLRAFWSQVQGVENLTEDAPAVTLLRIIMQQLIGWPWYLMNNITAAPTSLPTNPSMKWLGNSHFAPMGSLFRREEAHLILISDFGLLAMILLLCFAASRLGSSMVLLLYLQPYLWVNHWIVAITYLHHTHPKLPKFEPEAWTFIKGATATMDREFGFIGKYFFHGIIEFHVIHHLFS
ncbi:MAG: hypothetical protein Q9187_003418 [Circinaria calcarea]